MTMPTKSRGKRGSTDEELPPRKGRLRLRAIEMLRQRILSGELPPKMQLREVTLSKELGMSRTPVREAFQALAAEGLVNLLPNRSVVVSSLDKSEAADVFMVLGALEAFAGELACQRATAREIEDLSELQGDLEKYFKTKERLAYLEVNRAIHEHIVHASKSPSLIAAWRLLLPRAERARKITTLDHDRWAEAFQEHCDIFDAIRDRDVERIRTLMALHFNNGAEQIKQDEAQERARVRAERYAKAAQLGGQI